MDAGRQYLRISATVLKNKGSPALRYFSGLSLLCDFQVTNSEEDKIQSKPSHTTTDGGVLKKAYSAVDLGPKIFSAA